MAQSIVKPEFIAVHIRVNAEDAARLREAGDVRLFLGGSAHIGHLTGPVTGGGPGEVEIRLRPRLRVGSFAEQFTTCGYGPVYTPRPLEPGQVVDVFDDTQGPYVATVQPGVGHRVGPWWALVHVHHARPASVLTLLLDLPAGTGPGTRFSVARTQLEDPNHPTQEPPHLQVDQQVEILDEDNHLWVGVMDTVPVNDVTDHYEGTIQAPAFESRHPTSCWTTANRDPVALHSQDDLGMVCTCDPPGKQAATVDRARVAALLGRDGQPVPDDRLITAITWSLQQTAHMADWEVLTDQWSAVVTRDHTGHRTIVACDYVEDGLIRLWLHLTGRGYTDPYEQSEQELHESD
ncbi:MAG TPA: hypothetical protein VIH37_08690 [Candidatus Limnocylindrales bacterium]